MIRYVLPPCGLLLLACGVSAHLRERSTATLCYLVSMICGCVTLIIWPRHNSMLFDTMLHVPGLTRMLTDGLATLSLVLQFGFLSLLAQAWSRRRTQATVMYGILLLVLLVLWLSVRHVEGADMTAVSYSSFYGHPNVVLAWNVTTGIVIIYACAIAGWGALHVLQIARDRYTRVTGQITVVTLGAASLYGVLMVVEAVANHYGAPAPDVRRYTEPFIAGCAASVLATSLAAIFGRAVWRHLKDRRAARRQRQTLWLLRRDIIDATVLLSDLLARADEHTDVALVQHVQDECRARKMPAYECQVIAEAARWITLGRAQAVRTAWEMVDRPTAHVVDRALAADLANRVEEDCYFYGDVFRIARLALAPEQLPPLARTKEDGAWQRAAAAFLCEQLRNRAA